MKQSSTTHAAPPPPQREWSSDNTALRELLAKWKTEDATDDPELLRAADLELAEFKKTINDNRAAEGVPPLYP